MYDGNKFMCMYVSVLWLCQLRDGNSMVLFAEGTRSPDGSLKK